MGRKKKARKRANEAEKLETMAQAAGAYNAYRPYAQQALNRGLHQSLAAYQPANNVLGMMYGAPAQAQDMGFGGLVTRDMMGVGQTSKAPGFAGDQPFGGIGGVGRAMRGKYGGKGMAEGGDAGEEQTPTRRRKPMRGKRGKLGGKVRSRGVTRQSNADKATQRTGDVGRRQSNADASRKKKGE